MDEGAPPKVAEQLAEALRNAPRPAPSTELAVATATAPSSDPEPVAEPMLDEDEPTGPPWFALSMALAGVGAAASVLGGVGLAANGFAWIQADGATDGNVVTDEDAYDAVIADRGLYQGLGIAGAVALPVGVATLASGIGLLMWRGLDEAPEDEELALVD